LKLTVSVREARQALSVGNSLIWRLISRGELQTIRLGAKRLVVVASIKRLIDKSRVSEGA
jgi:excisionase family DNA binding protein